VFYRYRIKNIVHIYAINERSLAELRSMQDWSLKHISSQPLVGVTEDARSVIDLDVRPGARQGSGSALPYHP
jgi:hypothetical protein